MKTTTAANELELRALSPEEVDGVAGALTIGPFHIDYSEGCGCIDVGVGGVGVWFGRNGAGWYAGDKAGRVNW